MTVDLAALARHNAEIAAIRERADTGLDSAAAARRDRRFLLVELAAARVEIARLQAALLDVSDTLRANNIDMSGLAMQYPAVYEVGGAIQRARAALASPAEEEG